MRIFAMVVAKNEADRYLGAFLEWTKTFVDEICLYDDQSTDDTVDRALAHGALVGVRPDDVPAFLEHEGQFRQAAWRWMETTVEPVGGDWIICLDVDEFLVDERGEREALEEAARWVPQLGNALTLKIVEMFDQTKDGLYRRVDGFWNDIIGVRFIEWTSGGEFPSGALACGSVPTYAHPVGGPGPVILHMGYVDPLDRVAKHERYVSLPGHASSHVQSILRPGRVELWDGPLPFRT